MAGLVLTNGTAVAGTAILLPAAIRTRNGGRFAVAIAWAAVVTAPVGIADAEASLARPDVPAGGSSWPTCRPC